MAVFTAINLAVSVMQSFSRRGNGMEAVLKAQLRYLNLILDQLVNVQFALKEITESVLTLREDFKDYIAWQYQKELRTELLGAVEGYHGLLEAGQRNADIWESTPVKDRLNEYVRRVEEKRQAIAFDPDGWGPESAVIAPIAATMELAAMNRLGFPPEVQEQVSVQYIKWFERMLGQATGSISSFVRNAVKEHDDAIDKALVEKQAWVTDLQLNNFRIGGPQSSSGAAVEDNCFVFVGMGEEGIKFNDPFKARAWGLHVFQLTHQVGSSVFSFGGIENELSEDIGASILTYEKAGYVFGYVQNNSKDGFLPDVDTMCYWTKIEQPIPNVKQLKKDGPIYVLDETTGEPITRIDPESGKEVKVEKTDAQIQNDAILSAIKNLPPTNPVNEKVSSELNALLNVLNYNRAKLAFATRATEIAANARTRLVDFREYLGEA